MKKSIMQNDGTHSLSAQKDFENLTHDLKKTYNNFLNGGVPEGVSWN